MPHTHNENKESLKPQMEDFFVHPTSEVDENVTIGKNTRIWH